MIEPTPATPDTPQERDDKAADLAKDLRWFRREVRVYYFLVFLVLAIKVF